ncbi:chitin-binding domain-containing protein [Anopheles sinensis]|uniref:Chitin-binding domain-containing protein n=1 Tax=Anopheles sinensis TaxID=74873 RepID=A0A084W8C2_ANOSI|nr:chitin-binding domain-containing protein [Anopheles sinensis]
MRRRWTASGSSLGDFESEPTAKRSRDLLDVSDDKPMIVVSEVSVLRPMRRRPVSGSFPSAKGSAGLMEYDFPADMFQTVHPHHDGFGFVGGERILDARLGDVTFKETDMM